MKTKLFAFFIFYLFQPAALFSQICFVGKYEIKGNVKSVTSYEYEGEEVTDKIVTDYDKKGHELFFQKEHKGKPDLEIITSYNFKKKTAKKTITDFAKRSIKIELVKFKHHNVTSEIFLDSSRNLIKYTKYKYDKRHNEIAYTSFNADSSLRCSCSYFYDENKKIDFSKTNCVTYNGATSEECVMTGVYKSPKKDRKFDYNIYDNYRTAYTKDTTGNIVEVKQFDENNTLVYDYKYMDFDNNSNWHKKEIAPNHFIKLNITYY